MKTKGGKRTKKINSILERKMGMTYSAPKPRYRFGAPRGKTAPQYKGTKALSNYPFGKRLKTDKFCKPRYERAGSELENRFFLGKEDSFGVLL